MNGHRGKCFLGICVVRLGGRWNASRSVVEEWAHRQHLWHAAGWISDTAALHSRCWWSWTRTD